VRQNRDSRAASMSETAAAKTITITPSSSGLTAREKRLLVDRLRALASVSIGRRPGRARGGTTGATPKGRWDWAGGGNLYEGRPGPMSDSATRISRVQRRYLSAVACGHRWAALVVPSLALAPPVVLRNAAIWPPMWGVRVSPARLADHSLRGGHQ
jgi:hypothetical protein